jgi:hypothetical protein
MSRRRRCNPEYLIRDGFLSIAAPSLTARKDAGLRFAQTPILRHRERSEAIQKQQQGVRIKLDCRAAFSRSQGRV